MTTSKPSQLTDQRPHFSSLPISPWMLVFGFRGDCPKVILPLTVPGDQGHCHPRRIPHWIGPLFMEARESLYECGTLTFLKPILDPTNSRQDQLAKHAPKLSQLLNQLLRGHFKRIVQPLIYQFLLPATSFFQFLWFMLVLFQSYRTLPRRPSALLFVLYPFHLLGNSRAQASLRNLSLILRRGAENMLFGSCEARKRKNHKLFCHHVNLLTVEGRKLMLKTLWNFTKKN